MSKKFMTKARVALNNIKPYTPGKPIEEVKRELGISDVIKMASNENPLGPSSKAMEAMRKAIDSVHIYPDGNCFALKNAIARQKKVSEKQIIVGNGSDEIIKFLAETFINEGDNAIVASPSFSEYDFAVSLMGGKLKSIRLTKEFKHDLIAMRQAIDERTKLIFICNPNNPTGTIVEKKEMDDFMQGIPDDVIVVFDEAYHEYATSKDYPHGLTYVQDGWQNVIVLYTFSKIYGLAGVRVGYGIAGQSLLNWVSRVREPFNVNGIAQAAALAALDDVAHVAESQRVNEAGKNKLYQAFESMGLFYVPTNTNFIWFDVNRDCADIYLDMLKDGVIIRRGDAFGYPTYMRVTVGTPPQNKRFIASLKKALDKQ